jgi:hypothetical protein
VFIPYAPNLYLSKTLSRIEQVVSGVPSLYSWALACRYRFQIAAVLQLVYTETNAAE